MYVTTSPATLSISKSITSIYQSLPLVDILHKTSFSIDIKHTITIGKEDIE